MLLWAIAFGTFGATLAGGLFALHLKDRLCLVLGFSAGAVVAVAFFDLIPEALALGQAVRPPATTLSLVALGFLTYLVLDRLQMLRAAAEDPAAGSGDAMRQRGALGAASLSVHSFLDGIAIGVALQASPAVGMVVAVAVLAHDFSDGINTTSIVLKNGGSPRQAMRWLIVDALTPVAGIAATLFFRVPPVTIGILLALFAGFFLYVGASDLIPESHHAHPKLLTTMMTLLGAAVLYVAVALASA
jgi:zinc transporter ZupT